MRAVLSFITRVCRARFDEGELARYGVRLDSVDAAGFAQRYSSYLVTSCQNALRYCSLGPEIYDSTDARVSRLHCVGRIDSSACSAPLNCYSGCYLYATAAVMQLQ